MSLNRRGFLGAINLLLDKGEATTPAIRPPGSGMGSDFSACVSCDAPCAARCEEGIILLDNTHTPSIDFSKSGCTYCGECITACPHGVLVQGVASPHIDIKIEINPLKCLAWNKTICSSCKDPCREDAILFLGLVSPEIDMEKCTRCGFCVGVCPTQAVEMEARG